MEPYHMSESDLWETPPGFFDRCQEEAGVRCGLDVCALRDTSKCSSYFGPDHEHEYMRDGLVVPWPRHPVWMNPPYSEVDKWVRKAHQEWLQGTPVLALVAARTDTHWWHDTVMKASLVLFVRGRLRFYVDGRPSKNGAPFPSAVVLWKWSLASEPRFRTLEVR